MTVAGLGIEFEIPDDVQVNYLEEYNLQTATAVKDGIQYPAAIEVRNFSGNLVDITENKLVANDFGGYTVTYSVEIAGKKISKIMKISVNNDFVNGTVDFEEVGQETLFYNGDEPKSLVNIERVTYAEAGISAPQDGGQYCLKITPLYNNNNDDVLINIGREVTDKTTIEFDFYITGPDSAKYHLRINNNDTYALENHTVYNTWIDIECICPGEYVSQNGKGTLIPNVILVRLRPYTDLDRTLINFYIDNVVVTEAA